MMTPVALIALFVIVIILREAFRSFSARCSERRLASISKLLVHCGLSNTAGYDPGRDCYKIIGRDWSWIGSSVNSPGEIQVFSKDKTEVVRYYERWKKGYSDTELPSFNFTEEQDFAIRFLANDGLLKRSILNSYGVVEKVIIDR